MIKKLRAIFFDRDGVLLADSRDLAKPLDVCVLPGAFEAVRLARKSGFKIVVVSNQSRVARGIITFGELRKNDIEFRKKFNAKGAKIDKAYYCPHHPDFSPKCSCRKPEVGLFEKAVKDININIGESYMIGDQISDVAAGKKAGCLKCVIVGKKSKLADFCAKDVFGAVAWILEN